MKSIFHLLVLLLTFLTISCSSDSSITDISEDIIEPSKTGVALEIEFNDLETINEALIQLEVEPFSNMELESRRKVRSEKSCLNGSFKGDINSDKKISVLDLEKIFEIIKEYDNEELYPGIANGDGKLHVNKEYTGTTPSFWSVAHVGKLVTYDEGGSTDTVLDRYDAAVIIDLLIQDCN
ncbi:MAG: hypothetical protein P8M34_14180 [Saprospiraceae bacterium]|nr:hypothetical protein [Saprospiraceae bacterium]